ncbi:MAG: DUF5716 family protein [Clostridium sp.]|nr:DUF5716 family protein [Clostridium sp.]
MLGFHGNQVVIGYDLGNVHSQISYCYAEGERGKNGSRMTEEATNLYVPTVLCKRNQANQWYCGQEAFRRAQDGEGILIEDLLHLAEDGEPIRIEEAAYDPVALLTLFLKRSLMTVAGPDRIAALMLTCRCWTSRQREVLSQALAGLGLKTARVAFQSYGESYYCYMLHQEKELWKNTSLLLEYVQERVKVYSLNLNERTRPKVLLIEEEEQPFFPRRPMSEGPPMSENPPIGENPPRESPRDAGLSEQWEEQLDREFLAVARRLCEGKKISSVYLIGENYSEDWMKESLRYLCKSSRVFQGSNLYSKGACYAMRERMNPSGLEKEYVFLGTEKLKANVGMKVKKQGEPFYYALLDAGCDWRSAKNTCELYLREENDVELMVTPLNGKPARLARIVLEGIQPVTRIRLRLSMKGEDRLGVEVEDLGFGELLPSSGHEWKEELGLYED